MVSTLGLNQIERAREVLRIGRIREERIVNFLRRELSLSEGFEIKYNPPGKRGPDIEIKKNGIWIMVMESSNYDLASSFKRKRLYRYIGNLGRFLCKRVLIVSSWENFIETYSMYCGPLISPLYTESLLYRKGIRVLDLGGQDLGEPFWDDRLKESFRKILDYLRNEK